MESDMKRIFVFLVGIDGKVWIAVYSALTLLMGIVAFASKGAFKIPSEWVTILEFIFAVFGITKIGGYAKAASVRYIDSRYNSPAGQAPGEDPEI